MENKQKKVFFIVLGLLVLGIVFLVFFVDDEKGSGSFHDPKYDEFAICLKDKGAVFYGAFWCPHCQDQKKMFGQSSKLLPYVECSTPDGKGQTAICTEKDIPGYPTWEFADGSRMGSTVSFEKLSEKTGCANPSI